MSAQDKDIELLKVINELKTWSSKEESRVKALLAAGTNPNIKNEYGQTLLHVAVDEGNLELVKLLIENPDNPDKGANPNVPDQHGQTPLFFAQRYDYDEIATFLLEKGARVAQLTPNEQALWLAIRNKNYPEAEQLVASGDININAVDNYGATLLHTAVMNGTPEIVELLLSKGADVHAQEGMLTHTPLHFAAALRSNFPKENIELLIQYGADIEAKDRSGKTPLYCAVERVEDMSTGAKRAVCVDLAIQLLGHGANPDAATNKVDYFEGTPRSFVKMYWERLHVEQFSRAEKAYEKQGLRAEKIAAPQMAIEQQEQLLQQAIRKKDHLRCAQLLSAGRLSIDAVNGTGETLLHNAVKYGSPKVVVLLLIKGANVNAKNNLGQTPLHWAAVSQKNAAIDNINTLMRHGSDIAAEDVNGQTPLCYAVITKSFYTAQELIKHGANLDADTFIVDSSSEKLTARAYVQKHWNVLSVRILNEVEELYKVSNRNSQVSAQLLGRSLSQVTNASSLSSFPAPQTEYHQSPTPT